MENASKALLIAGSILIVILLIAMGVRTFNSTAGTVDSAETTMNATERATFNSKFTAYAGTGKSAAQVKALANVIIANNATNKLHKVKLKVLDKDETTDATTITENVSALTSIYTVTVTYSDGYVTNISIS